MKREAIRSKDYEDDDRYWLTLSVKSLLFYSTKNMGGM